MPNAVPFVREAILEDAIVLSKHIRKLDKLEIKYSHNISPIGALMSAFQTQNGKNYSIVDDDGYVYAMFGVSDCLENYGNIDMHPALGWDCNIGKSTDEP